MASWTTDKNNYKFPRAILAVLDDKLYAVHGDHLWEVNVSTGKKSAVNEHGWRDTEAMTGHKRLLYIARHKHLHSYDPNQGNNAESRPVGELSWERTAAMTSREENQDHVFAVEWPKDIYLVDIDPNNTGGPGAYRELPHNHKRVAMAHYKKHFYVAVGNYGDDHGTILKFGGDTDNIESFSIGIGIDSMVKHGDHIYA